MLLTIFRASRASIEKSLSLVEKYDDKVYTEIMEEEDNIDRLTDHLSRYMVEMLPLLRNEYHVSILDEYYKVTAEFERLGDFAVNISDIAATLAKSGTSFSKSATNELHVLYDVLDQMLGYTERSFEKRDIDAAYRIEPLVQLSDEIINTLKGNHLKRMAAGVCNVYADAGFTNLLGEMKRITGACSNVGVATVVRVRPELADHEHYYYTYLHSGSDENFNRSYNEAHEMYYARLRKIENADPILRTEIELPVSATD